MDLTASPPGSCHLIDKSGVRPSRWWNKVHAELLRPPQMQLLLRSLAGDCACTEQMNRSIYLSRYPRKLPEGIADVQSRSTVRDLGRVWYVASGIPNLTPPHLAPSLASTCRHWSRGLDFRIFHTTCTHGFPEFSKLVGRFNLQ